MEAETDYEICIEDKSQPKVGLISMSVLVELNTIHTISEP